MDSLTGGIFSSAPRLLAVGRPVCVLLLAIVAVGCQNGGPTVSNRALLAHLPGVDFAGLNPPRSLDSVKVTCSIPSDWVEQNTPSNGLYSIEQFKSPSFYTGAGIVYARLPFPVNAKALIWLAKLEYCKSSGGGKALGEWTDELGRPWFEAENETYHIRGYAMTDGFDAWLVYYGYKINRPLSPSALSLAARCVDTVIPNTGGQSPAHSRVASASATRK